MTKKQIIILWLTATVAYGQQDRLNHLISQINEAHRAIPAVKLHLFFHQPQYAPGDTAFFRAALVAAAETLPLKGSQLAELDIINDKGEVMLHQQFRIRDGWSGSQVIIPSTMPPGIYRVVAYTNWMRNFGPQTFFQGDLYIAGKNQFHKGELSASITLFPEGGKLVAGVRNKIVVRSTVPEKNGVVMNSDRQTVAMFTLNNMGYGFFFITPVNGERYIVAAGEKQADMGPAEEDGISLLMFPAIAKGPSHRFVLQVPAGSALRDESLYFLVSSHGDVHYSSIVRFGQQDYATLSVPTGSLPEGVVRAAVIRDDGSELASRLVFTRNVFTRLRMEMEDSVVAVRSDVSVRMALSDDSGNPLQARLSVSVYNRSVFDQADGQPDIEHYLLTSSNASGFYDKPPTPPAFDWMLQASAWVWPLQNNVQARPALNYYPRNYLSLQGRLLNLEDNKPVSDSLLLTIYLQGVCDVYEIETSANGEFVAAPLFDFPDRDELMFVAERKGKRIPVKLELMEDRIHYPQTYDLQTSDKESAYYHYARLREQVKKSFGYYRKSPGAKIADKTGKNELIEEMLLGADLSFKLSDYTIFPTMQETLHEIIPYLQYRKIRGNEVVRMYLPDIEKTGEGPPVFIIDGILTLDYRYFLNLKPSSVETIKLVYARDKQSKLGALGRNGIVLVETKIANNENNVPRTSSVMVQGVVPSLGFNAGETQWESENSKSPRLRPVLYWNPSLQLDSSGSMQIDFTTGDDVGEYMIVVEGLTFDGIPFRAEKKFTVRYQPAIR